VCNENIRFFLSYLRARFVWKTCEITFTYPKNEPNDFIFILYNKWKMKYSLLSVDITSVSVCISLNIRI